MLMTMQPDIMLRLLKLSESLKESRLETHFSKLVSLCHPLSTTHSFKYIDHYLTETIPSYIALKSLIIAYMADIVKQPEDTKTLIQETTSAIFGELGTSDPMVFNKTDRSILLKMLSLNMQWVQLFLGTPEENVSYRDLAYIDAYPALQKIDLIFATIFLIATQNVEVDDRSVVHGLCLAAKRYLKEADTALFINNPILINRLREPSVNISNAEMEHLLELSS